jgi:hypothetical protein
MKYGIQTALPKEVIYSDDVWRSIGLLMGTAFRKQLSEDDAMKDYLILTMAATPITSEEFEAMAKDDNS